MLLLHQGIIPENVYLILGNSVRRRLIAVVLKSGFLGKAEKT